MKITDMHITPIAITDPPLLNAAGLHAPYALRAIVEIVTDDNQYGLGEVPGNIDTLNALEEARDVIVGQDPFQLNTIQLALVDRFGEEGAHERGAMPWDHRRIVHVNSAIEVALLDIMGKASRSDRSVICWVAGFRERAEFSAYLFYKYEGAGGTLEFGTDPNATAWAAARQAGGGRSQMVSWPKLRQCVSTSVSSRSNLRVVPSRLTKKQTRSSLCMKPLAPAHHLRLDPNAIWTGRHGDSHRQTVGRGARIL